ncbi:DNA polymerase III subunit delta' [Chloroflexota bacterium]
MWQIIGQDRIVSLWQGALAKGSLAHAYLLVGPPHVGKMTLALNLAQALNCAREEPPCGECPSCQKIAAGGHADVQIIGLIQNGNAEAKLIGIDQVKEMQHTAYLPPFEGRYKVFIIDGAELLSVEAANCLLKTLEEPVSRVVFILLTTNDSLLLETVVSRCQRLELRPLAVAEVEAALADRWSVPRPQAELLARLCHGCLGWALQATADDSLLRQRDEELAGLCQLTEAGRGKRIEYALQLAAQYQQDRARVYEVLGLWQDYWRDLLLIRAGCPEDLVTNVDRRERLQEEARGYSLAQIRAFIDGIQASGQQLQLNANPRLVLEVLMMDMPERINGGQDPLYRG